MTDNYQDEMREALELGREYAKGALAAHDAAYQGHSATEAERVMIVDDIAKLDAALSCLSAQDETAGDAPWNARDTEALRVNAEQKRKIAELEARLSASGQGERSCETCSAPNGAECARRNCSGAPAFDRWEPAAQDAAPAPEPESQHGKTCPKASHNGEGYLHGEDDDSPYSVDGMDYCGRCHRAMDAAPAPEKGEAKHE